MRGGRSPVRCPEPRRAFGAVNPVSTGLPVSSMQRSMPIRGHGSHPAAIRCAGRSRGWRGEARALGRHAARARASGLRMRRPGCRRDHRVSIDHGSNGRGGDGPPRVRILLRPARVGGIETDQSPSGLGRATEPLSAVHEQDADAAGSDVDAEDEGGCHGSMVAGWIPESSVAL